MKHGTLKIHSKEWVTLFQQINTDITQTAEGGVEGCVCELRQGADMGDGGWGSHAVRFSVWQRRGRALRGRIKEERRRKRGRNWERGERGDIWCGVGVYPTSTHTCTYAWTLLCKHTQPIRERDVEEGGTSGPMSQLLGVEREGEKGQESPSDTMKKR